MAQQFGVAAEDATKVQQWLQTQGLTVHEISQSRRFIVFSGTVGQVEQAFATEMHNYSYKNIKYIANATDMQVPSALAQVVKGVVRLHSDPRLPNLKIGAKIGVDRKTGKIEGQYGQHFMGPADFATIYNVKPLYAAGIDGDRRIDRDRQPEQFGRSLLQYRRHSRYPRFSQRHGPSAE